MSGSSRLRKRDVMRDLLRKPKKPSPSLTSISHPATPWPSQAVPTSAAPSAPTASSKQAGERFLEDALAGLTSEEQSIIRAHLAPNIQDIGTAVDRAYSAALSKKQVCESKRWRWSVGGREIVLREEAEKVLHWLDRFKSVGDVVANVDPLHIGLPWAGIRMLLEIAVSESHQMAALLVGMSLALWTSNRLQAYFEYFQRLPAALTTTNFENALIKTYTHVLKFVATAIRTYQTNVATLIWYALWEPSTLETFESECDKLGSRTEIEASNCDRELSVQDRESTKQLREELNKTLRTLDNIQMMAKSLNDLHTKFDLSKLQTAKGAMYNSYAEGNLAHCLRGTRTHLLRQIADWADDPNGKCIFWLSGMAGTGKSTISRTVADALHKRQGLGASFFFKRGEGDRGNASLFFSTIASQLADTIPGLEQPVAQALDADSRLCERNLQEQFEKLLSQPLLDTTKLKTSFRILVIVIDALDECKRKDDIRTILRLLAQVEAISSMRVRVFVTSRPELPIQLGFLNISRDLHQDVVLEEVQATTIEHDIRVYFSHAFAEIRSERLLKRPADALPTDWPSDTDMQTLVNLAVPLFIFASTVCRFVSESNPRRRLERILQQQNSLAYSGLAKTYLPILSQITADNDEEEQKKAIAEFREVVGPIVLLADPLSVTSLADLLEIDREDIGDMLENLHSVINIPVDPHQPVRLLHLSFRDFLVDPKKEDRDGFWVDESQTHSKLAEQCLRRLDRSGTLGNDLCGIGKPGLRRAEVSRQVMTSHISPGVAYACCYWVWHILESREGLHDDGHVHQFLLRHFLHWMEALSWLGRLSSLVAHISTLRSLVRIERGAQLLALLDDANRFALRNRHVVDLAPLQLYSSALIFAPSQSIIRRCFEHQCTKWLSLSSSVPLIWSAEIQTLEGHKNEVNAVAFSPNGDLLASGSGDGTIRLWDATTGEEIRKLEGHDNWVNAVAFSPDGKVLVSSSLDQTIRLWSVPTGEEKRKFKGHDDWINAVAFSPNGQVIASASRDQTVKLWDATTCEIIQTLEGHDDWVRSVAFSPHGQVLASASRDRTVRLWNANTGEETQKFQGHEEWVNTVAFSPNGKVLASASGDKTVRMWDVATGKMLQKIEAHRDWVNAVAFSPNGKVIASASHDQSIRLWDTITGEETQKLEGHNDWVNTVAFSPNGKVLASASGDRTIRLWDVTMCEDTRNFQGHDELVNVVAFSPDGKVLASASLDQTVKLWDATTGKETRNLEGHVNAVWALAFSSAGKMLASASHDQTIRLWDTTTGGETQKFEVYEEWVNTVAFSPNGQLLASASSDRTVRIWNVTAGSEVLHFNSGNVIGRMSFSDDGKSLETDIGNIDFRTQIHSPSTKDSRDSVPLVLSDRWIRYRSDDLLWLPYDYQGNCSALHGDVLAVGQRSGAVSFFRLDVNQIDRCTSQA